MREGRTSRLRKARAETERNHNRGKREKRKSLQNKRRTIRREKETAD